MQDKNLELMEKAPVKRAILTLALPTIFSSIASPGGHPRKLMI